MHMSPNAEFKVLERRIQTLTSILQNMERPYSSSPTTGKDPQVPVFLRHLATLLACGKDAKRVIAVTGSLACEESWILVVAQNPSGSGNVSEFGVKEITKSSGTFEEVVNGERNSKLSEHISDVWAAIDLYDPDNKDQFHLFCLFIATRCFRKLSKCVSQVMRTCGVSVSQKIFEWTPDSQELDDAVTVRWIDRPRWLLEVQAFYPRNFDGMRERKMEKFGQLVTQWEFSAATLQTWAWLLAEMLRQLEVAIEATEAAQQNRQTDQEIEKLKDITSWCQYLWAYVYWKEDVVKTLLTKTSLSYVFDLCVVAEMSEDAEPDEPASLQREPGESDHDGQRVLRHLQAIVAWHAAATSLLDKKYHCVTQTLHVGLVEVTSTPSKSNLMTDEEVIQEFFHRRPYSSPEACTSIANIIRENLPKKFTGTSTTHAEVTLMGLLTYFSPGSSSINYGDQIEEASLHFLQELIKPVTFEKPIAAGKKCCWCCDRLSRLLGDIKLPGSHGVLYSWTPPWMGVDVTVLQTLENELWDQMNMVVLSKIPRRGRFFSPDLNN